MNRQRQHSVNVQIVFDASYEMTEVLARWPGSVSGATILDKSGLKVLFEEDYVPVGCYLVGDSDYPSKQCHGC